MDYAEIVSTYLRGQDIAVGTVAPDNVEVPLFEIVASPRPFKQGEALALREVCRTAAQYCAQVATKAPGRPVQAIVFPGIRPEDCVSIRMGVFSVDSDKAWIVSEHGCDIQCTIIEDAH